MNLSGRETQRNLSYSDRVAVVTGASSGIGAAIVEELVHGGASVVAFDIDGAGLSSLFQNRNTIRTFEGDVRELTSLNLACAEAERFFGHLDLVYNNAGIARIGPIIEAEANDFRGLWEVNVLGVLHGIQAGAEIFRRNGTRGRIINVSSWVASRPAHQFGLYAATKAAVDSLTRTAASELAPDRISVNAIAPGSVDTDMSRVARAQLETMGTEARTAIPAPLLGRSTTQEVARVAGFLATEGAAAFTGQVLHADGGIVIG